jgi:hypothetical protein
MKHAEKMVKICQTGLLKLNFETRPKKRIFRFLPKISAGHGWSWKFFLPIPNPWALRVSGMGCYTSKCEKSQNHCTLLCKHELIRNFGPNQIFICPRAKLCKKLVQIFEDFTISSMCWNSFSMRSRKTNFLGSVDSGIIYDFSLIGLK